MGKIRRKLIEKSPSLELTRICEVNPHIRKNIEGCKTFESHEQLLEEDIDAMFVCTPNQYSPDIIVAGVGLLSPLLIPRVRQTLSRANRWRRHFRTGLMIPPRSSP